MNSICTIRFFPLLAVCLFLLGNLFGQPETKEPYVILYSNENYSGNARRLKQGDSLQSIDALSNFRMPSGALMIGSVEIYGAVDLVLWDQKAFRGETVTLSQSHASFDPVYPANQNWKGRIASIRVRSARAPQQSDSRFLTITPSQSVSSQTIQTPLRNQVNSGEVRIYTDAGFTGSSLSYNASGGEPNLLYLSRLNDNWNDNISSIYIRGNFSVVLYQDLNFEGDALRIDESVSNLRELRRRDPNRRNWNDAVSSIEILTKDEESKYSSGKERYAGAIYANDNFQGRYLNLYDGQEISNLRDEQWNDRLSSVMVERGYKIILFKDSNFEGESIVIDLLQPSLKSFPGRWDDQVSSLRVVRVR
jgi:hypothetical protein